MSCWLVYVPAVYTDLAWRSSSERRFHDDHDRKVIGSTPNPVSLLSPWATFSKTRAAEKFGMITVSAWWNPIKCFMITVSAWWNPASSKSKKSEENSTGKLKLKNKYNS